MLFSGRTRRLGISDQRKSGCRQRDTENRSSKGSKPSFQVGAGAARKRLTFERSFVKFTLFVNAFQNRRVSIRRHRDKEAFRPSPVAQSAERVAVNH